MIRSYNFKLLLPNNKIPVSIIDSQKFITREDALKYCINTYQMTDAQFNKFIEELTPVRTYGEMRRLIKLATGDVCSIEYLDNLISTTTWELYPNNR